MKKIYEKRGQAWAFHYRNRETARAMCNSGWNGVQVSNIINQYIPAPQMQIDGSLLDIPLDIKRRHVNSLLNHFRLSLFQRDLLCVWYWTEAGWLEFVRQYQSLPEVFEDYYYKYEPEPNDRYLLVPVSSKPKQGSGKVVDNLVDKSGTKSFKKVQVRQFEKVKR